MNTPISIPFNRPGLTGNEQQYIGESLAHGHIAGGGPFTARCEQLLQNALGVPRALLTTSCTHALEMSALLLDIGPGDEVIVPSFTFVSTANAFAARGARIVFADVRPDTFNLDETQLEALICPRTKAIVPVHYAGVGCEMNAIMALAKARDIAVIEDNAHGLFARYKGQELGTFGELSTLSFHETKNLICGEGGALIINHAARIERAEILRDKGTNRSRFLRGEVDKYTWVDIGSSYVISDLLAAFLLAQLEAANQVLARRSAVWNFYFAQLQTWAHSKNIALPFVPDDCQQSYHMFYLVLPSLEARQSLIAHLRERGILSVFHYVPLHLSPMGQTMGGFEGQCPIAERAGNCLLRLPFYNDLSEAEQTQVVRALHEWDG